MKRLSIAQAAAALTLCLGAQAMAQLGVDAGALTRTWGQAPSVTLPAWPPSPATVVADLVGQDRPGGPVADASDPLAGDRSVNLFAAEQSAHQPACHNRSGLPSGCAPVPSRLTLLASWIDDWLHGAPDRGACGDAPGNCLNTASRPAALAGSSKLRWLVSSGQTLTSTLDDMTLRLAFGGQHGGAATKASPLRPVGVPAGQLASAELRLPLGAGLPQLAAFVDLGRAGYGRRGSQRKRFALQGVGLSLAWQHPGEYTLRAVWAPRSGVGAQAGALGTGAANAASSHLWLVVSGRI